MRGNDVFKIAVNTMGKLAKKTLENSDYSVNNIDWLIPHQANRESLRQSLKKLISLKIK